MKTKFLFSNKYKKVAWIVFIPSSILGIIVAITEYSPSLLNCNVLSIFDTGFDSGIAFFRFKENNILNEVLGIIVILSGLFVAFSKEKEEDEYINKIRLESLVWAVFVNYFILLFTFIFFFDFTFWWVMVFNMFTVLLLFIIRFNWKIYQLNRKK